MTMQCRSQWKAECVLPLGHEGPHMGFTEHALMDWERWAREVLTDFRVPFDNHTVGLRLGIVQLIHDMRDAK